jgi:hypothetical protein
MMANLMLDFEPPVPFLENTLNQSLNDKNPIKYVITEEVKNKLVPIKYKNILEKNENEQCSITQEKFDDDSDVIQLPCNHCFNKDAIIMWLTKEKGECPVCRYKFECVETKTSFDENDSSQENINNNQIGLHYNDFTNYHNEFFILPSYLVNEPQTQYNNQPYFDFFRAGPSSDEENP